jgi:hypothetical protein
MVIKKIDNYPTPLVIPWVLGYFGSLGSNPMYPLDYRVYKLEKMELELDLESPFLRLELNIIETTFFLLL